MPPLKFEVFDHRTESWRTLKVMQPGEQYGSLSSNTTAGREMYYFGIDVPEGKAVIKKSEVGIDVELGANRLIHALGEMTTLASLDPGESYEMPIQTDLNTTVRTVKFTHVEE